MLMTIITAVFIVIYIFNIKINIVDGDTVVAGCCSGHSCAGFSNNCGGCRAGRYTSTPSAGVCTCGDCTGGTYCPGDGCAYACPAGRCQAIGLQASCIVCPKGQYQPSERQTGCLLCPVGYCQPYENQPRCNICPAGQCQPFENQQICNKCSAGKYQPNQGQGSCGDCPRGKYQPNEEQRGCSDCPTGQYQGSQGQTGCNPCPVGQYQGSEGQTGCNPCPVGQYQGSQGKAGCNPCPTGQYQGSQGQTGCNPCPTGQYQESQGQTGCNLCPLGQYQGSQGQTGCNLCPVGQYQPNQGQTGCNDCPVGQYQGSQGKAGCNLCPVGQYQPNQRQTGCNLCPIGQYQPNQGQTGCNLCAQGQYNPNQGQTGCTNCPPGTYNVYTGRTSVSDCVLCAPGKYNPNYGSITSDACSLCEVGKFASSPGLSACVSCPIRYFSYDFNIPGATICYPNPTSQPSSKPSTQPSSQPSSSPTKQPSIQPSRHPTRQPTSRPSRQPSRQPSSQPSSKPSKQPSSQPSTQPSSQPTCQPSYQPTCQPSSRPSYQPSTQPSNQPSSNPSLQPSSSPSYQPSFQPSLQPFSRPTMRPSYQPTSRPSFQPRSKPSKQPTLQPLSHPSRQPSKQPTMQPTAQPVVDQPSSMPSIQPTTLPLEHPSTCPSRTPSFRPSSQPFFQPSSSPSLQPYSYPTPLPVCGPTTIPSSCPSYQPTSQPSSQPLNLPSRQPVVSNPSVQPSLYPSTVPSLAPSFTPSCDPTEIPSQIPISKPSKTPSNYPTVNPSINPTFEPSRTPSQCPSIGPSKIPTLLPTHMPSLRPIGKPTDQPSKSPSRQPSGVPSHIPTDLPTCKPSNQPSFNPSIEPTRRPSCKPSEKPTVQPFIQPVSRPSIEPSNSPMTQPSSQPSFQPVKIPTKMPIVIYPSHQPTFSPSSRPSYHPSRNPSRRPIANPSFYPTVQPSILPKGVPSNCPSMQPVDFPSSVPSFLPSQMKKIIIPADIASNISDIVVLSNNQSSSVSLLVSLSDIFPSVVYCAAFRIIRGQSVFIPKANNDIIGNNYFSFSHDKQAIVIISNLVSSSYYNIYCTAVSLSGKELSFNFIKKLKNPFVTQCCKTIYYSLQKSKVAYNSINFNFIDITVDYSPTVNLYIQVEVNPVSKLNNRDSYFKLIYSFPSYLNISYRDQYPYSTALTFIAGVTGDYYINVSISGFSVNEYSLVQPVNNVVHVYNSVSEPPVPTILSAIFNDDGSYIIITFDSNTNKGGFSSYFICSTILYFLGSLNSKCQWVSSSSIYIYPSFNSKVTDNTNSIFPGSIITLLPNKIKATCNTNSSTVCASFRFTNSQNVSVQISKSPQVPIVSISAPNIISSCNNLVLDLTNSVGDGGRPWNKIRFEVTNSGIGNSSLISNFLNFEYNIHPPTPIPFQFLIAKQTYAFKIYLTNFLGVTGYEKQVVYVTDVSSNAPMLSLLGQRNRVMYTYASLQLTSIAYTINCNGILSYDNLTYIWSVSELSNGNYIPSKIKSESQNAAIFKLSPYVLVSSKHYLINLQVAYSNGFKQLSSRIDVSIFVVPSNIVALINEGSTKTVKIGTSSSIDASFSYDRDLPIGKNSTKLSYLWSCQQISPKFSLNCPLQLLSPLNKAILFFHTSKNSSETSSRLMVSVFDEIRTSSAFIDVITIHQEVSQLSISSSSISLTSVNVNQKFTLIGGMKLIDDCQAEWTIDNNQIQLPEVSLTQTSVYFKASTMGSKSLFYLSLPAYTLTGNTNYKFTLTCGESYTSITITTNAGPIPGALVITPISGMEMSTLFYFNAVQWTDPDLPMKYQFGFISQTSFINLVIVSVSELTFTSTRLPAGLKDQNYLINCTLNVFDGNMAKTSMDSQVEVKAVNVSSRLEYLNALLSTQSGSVNDKTNLVSSASASLNTVDCLYAPNCSQLNRLPCLKTQHTCSSCVTGYLGEIKDSNTPCLSVINFAQIIKLGNTANCLSDKDCSIVQVCNVTTKTCIKQSKVCPGNCMKRGYCYYSDINTGKILNDCKIDDITCDAICHCNNEYSGISCEMTLDELKKRQSIRAQLVTVLYSLTLNDDISSENLGAWSTSLSSCSQNQFELSYDTAHISEKIAERIINSAINLNLDRPDDLTGVLQSIDAITMVEKYNYNPSNLNNVNEKVVFNNYSASRIENIISKFSDLVSQSMVIGQKKIDYIYNNFRMTADIAIMERSISHEVLAPKTSFEYLKNIRKGTISLHSVREIASSVSISTVVIETLAKSYGSTATNINSNPIRIKVSNVNNIDKNYSINSFLSGITFTFMHNLNHDKNGGFQNNVKNYTTLCFNNDKSVYQYQCADTGYIISRNCSGKSTTFVDICPYYFPSCDSINITTGSILQNSLCTVSNYTSQSTSCTCLLTPNNFNDNYNSRALSSTLDSLLDSSGVSSLVDASKYISSDFIETSSIAITGNASQAFHQIYITFAIISSFWGFAFLLLIYFWLLNEKTYKRVKDASQDNNKDINVQQKLLYYIESLFPAVYSESSIIDSLRKELFDKHLYFSLFANSLHFRSSYGRYLQLLKLLTLQTMMIFLLALLYDFQTPNDDGSCALNMIEDDCLMRKRLLDSSISYCAWVNNSCVYSNSPDSLKTLLYIIVISSILTSIFATPIEILIRMLDSPTEEKSLKISDKSKLSSINKVIYNKSKKYNISEKIQKARALTQVQRFSAIHNHKRSTIYPVEKEKVADFINPFLLNIIENRRLLKLENNEKLKEYSEEWDIELLDNHDMNLFCVNEKMKDNIRSSMLDISQTFQRINLQLDKEPSEQQIGLIIIHYFILDLIGYKSLMGNIFNNKFHEDFELIEPVVLYRKIFAGFLIIVLNGFFIYYTIIKSYTKGLSWQVDFMNAVIVQFAVEVLLNSTLECCWINIIIPLILRKEIIKIKDIIRQTIIDFVVDRKYEYKLDSPIYLFVSTQLALQHPNILESQLVLSYHSFFPGAISKTWKRSNKKLNKWKSRNLMQYLLTFFWVFFRILHFTASIPYFYQKIIIRLFQPIILSGLIIVWYSIIASPILLGVVSTSFGLIIVYIFYRYFGSINNPKIRNVTPLTNIIPTCMNESIIENNNGHRHPLSSSESSFFQHNSSDLSEISEDNYKSDQCSDQNSIDEMNSQDSIIDNFLTSESDILSMDYNSCDDLSEVSDDNYQSNQYNDQNGIDEVNSQDDFLTSESDVLSMDYNSCDDLSEKGSDHSLNIDFYRIELSSNKDDSSTQF